MSTIDLNPNDRLKIEDILLSRTDSRGVIQAGNNSFQEVSVYSWEKLIGAPHKIVRHPDMPSGVFHMLWEYIKQGKTIGAYVQNMAEDGVPYWVLATIVPVDDGFLSVRVKPSVGNLEQIIPIYEDVRKEELAGNLTPKESAKMISAKIVDLGYHNYEEFTSFALQDEVTSRDIAMGHKVDPVREKLAVLFRGIREMEEQAARVGETFNKTHQIPYNMRLQAGRLEGSDGPISVISSNHRQMTQGLEEHLSRFNRDSKLGAEAIRSAVFKSSFAQVLEHAAATFQAEETGFPGNKDRELQMLRSLTDQYRQTAIDEVRALSDKVRRFGQLCNDMRRMMSGLELTRIMCKIERSKFDGEHAGLDEIVNRLADTQTTLNHNFDEILNSVSAILSHSESIQRSAPSLQKSA